MSDQFNNILGLQLPTDPRWVNLASINIEEILTDHAYCELKAATQCISIIQTYPHYTEIVDEISPVVTEEWGHFRMVLAELKKRGMALGRQRKDEYVNQLIHHMPKGLQSHDALLHKLLFCALIEARSCERFRLLSSELEDEHLKKFYYRFMVSEAGHYRLFIDLAKKYFDAKLVDEEWHKLLIVEKNILSRLPTRGDRMH